MKNLKKCIGIIVLVTLGVFSITACSTSSGSNTGSYAASTAHADTGTGAGLEPSTLTITGLEKWNGKRIQADSDDGDPESIYAAARVINGDEYDPMAGAKGVGVVIADGTAALNVWNLKIGEMDWDTGSVDITAVPYTGNDTVEFTVQIWDGGETFHYHSFVARGTVTAAFSGGAARSSFVFEYERDPDMWD
ncbi:MAG: hypothetical protein FWC03_11255 [Treponema sp.]|nr:hypothetical protein [Treponema sp.]